MNENYLMISLVTLQSDKPVTVWMKVPSLMNRLGRFSSVVKSKSAVVREKMINYIKNEQQPTERSVSCGQYLVLLVGFDVREKMRPFSIARSLTGL